MKTRLNTALVLSSILASLALTASARAEDCTTEAQATVQNVYSCNLPDSTRARLVSAWIVDPAIQKTADFDSLVNGIGTFSDATLVNPALEKLIAQDDLSNDKKAIVVRNASSVDGKLSPKLRAYIEKTALHYQCQALGDAALSQYTQFGPKNADLAETLAYSITNCSWDSANLKTAVDIVGEGYTAGVLPLMDRLAKWKVDSFDVYPQSGCHDNTSGRYWYEGFENIINASLRALGRIRSTRAMSVVSSYTNNIGCATIVRSAQAAVNEIQTGINLANIRKGNADAIEWGMDLIQNHNGSYETVQNQVLDAFTVSMTNVPATKAKIKRFLRDEYASGYHAGNTSLNARLLKLSK